MTEWISVKHRLPEDGKRCLGFCNIVFDEKHSWSGIVDVAFSRNYGWSRCDSEGKIFVSHWTDYPNIPKE